MVFGTGQVILLAVVCFTVVHADSLALTVFSRPKCQAPDSRQGLCDRRSLPYSPGGQQRYLCVALTPDPCPGQHHWQLEGTVCFIRDLAFNCTRGKWTRTDEGLLQEHRHKRFIEWFIAGVIVGFIACAIFCPRRGPPPNSPPKFTSCPTVAIHTAPEGQKQAKVSWAIPTAKDSEDGTLSIKIRHGLEPGSLFPEGTTYITYEAKDSGGLIDLCYIEVQVNVIWCSLLRAPQYGQRPECTGAGRDENLFGARCQFSCYKGYTLRDYKDTLTCQKNRKWSHPLPRCSPVPCGDPAPVPNGVLQCRGDHTYQNICDLQCRAGYSRATHSYTSCNANGQWTPGVKCEDTQAPTFPNGCPPDRREFSGPLGSPVNVTWKDPETKDNEDPKNVTLTSTKRSGSPFAVGFHTVKVTATDSAGNTGSCSFTVQVQERECPSLTRPDDGHVTCDRGQLEGSKCRVRCEKGHEVRGAAIVTCQGNSTWSAGLPSCPKVRCPDKVPEVKGGNVRCPGSAVYGTSCSLFCLPGYDIRPPIFIRCTANGTWSAAGSCQDTAEPELECPDNLEVFASPLGQNTSVTWSPATVTDNSGENLTATSDVMPGSHFGVGLTYVTYTATDSSGNRGSCRFFINVKTQSCGRPDLEDPARNVSVMLYQCPQGHVHGAQCTLNCSYGYPLQGATTITCERDDSLNPPLMSWRFNGTQPLCIQNQCPPLDPPQNGALSCVTANYGTDCLMSCHANYDIQFAFDGHFVCTNSERRWRPATVPQCLVAFRPGQAKLSSEFLYFTNSCEVSLQQIKENFIRALSNSRYRDACVNVPSCTVDNVQVTCGPFSRRRRSVGSQGSEAGHDRLRRVASGRQKILIKFDIVMDFALNGTEEETFSSYKSLESGMNTVLREEAGRGLYNIDSLTPDLRYFRSPTLDFDGCPNGTRYHQKFTSTKPSCVGCSKGHFLQGTRCAQCPRGQYTALDNATSCTECPPGFSTLTSATDSKDHCKELCTLGYFSSDGFVPCQPCPAGSYQSRDQGVSCDLCPAGTWTEFAAAKSRNDCVAADVKLTSNASLTASLTSEQQSMTVMMWLKLSTNCSLSVDVGLSVTSSSSSPLTLAVFTEGADDALETSTFLQIPANQWVRLMMVSQTEGGGLTLIVYNGRQAVLNTPHPALSTPFNATFTITTLRGTGLVSGLHGQSGGWTRETVEVVSVSCTDHMDNNTLNWAPLPASVTTPSLCDAVDECQSRPCGPQGMCQNGLAGFLCHCQQGWSGDTCQVAPDACYQHQCQDSSRCVPAGQNYTCECPEEKSGRLCQLEKVHGEWGEWGQWSQCAPICAGRQRRQRLCNNPAPANEGRHCSGPSSESQSCGDLQCLVDGAWSTWSPWSQCNTTCGGGERSRSRRCDNPEPQHGGAKCSGPSLDLHTCAAAVCPVQGGWGNWSEWSPCSVTCGDGIQSRERSCDNPVPANKGQPCQGLANQTRPCNRVVCPVCSELPVVDGTIFNCSTRADPYRKTCRVQCTRGYSTVSPQVYTCGQETGYLWDFQRQGTAVEDKYAIQYCTRPRLPIKANMNTVVPMRGASCAYMDNISLQISLNLRDLPCHTLDKCSTVVKGSCGPPSSPTNGARRRREVEGVVMVTVNFTANFQQSLAFNGSDNSTLEEFIRDFRLVDESAALIALNDTERLFTATVDNVTFTPDVNGSSYTAALGCAPGAALSADGGCVDCPAGLYEEGGRCVLCPLGQYQDRTGSTSCQHCPLHTSWDSPGATQLSQCLGAGTQATTTTGDTTTEEATEGEKTNTGIIIAAAIGAFIAVAVIITVIVVCWLKKRKETIPSFTPAQPETMVFGNALYQHPHTARGADFYSDNKMTNSPA